MLHPPPHKIVSSRKGPVKVQETILYNHIMDHLFRAHAFPTNQYFLPSDTHTFKEMLLIRKNVNSYLMDDPSCK